VCRPGLARLGIGGLRGRRRFRFRALSGPRRPGRRAVLRGRRLRTSIPYCTGRLCVPRAGAADRSRRWDRTAGVQVGPATGTSHFVIADRRTATGTEWRHGSLRFPVCAGQEYLVVPAPGSEGPTGQTLAAPASDFHSGPPGSYPKPMPKPRRPAAFRAGGCANGFWHSLAKTVAGVCDPGPPRTAGLTEASYKDPGRQNPLAHPVALTTARRAMAGGLEFETPRARTISTVSIVKRSLWCAKSRRQHPWNCADGVKFAPSQSSEFDYAVGL
jgi:hypothetical protein